MNANLQFKARQKGSALLATLCFAAVLSLSLSSYLAVCYRSLVLSNRVMQSGHGLELAEVGMEEALWAFNNGGFDASWTKNVATGIATKTINAGFNYENGANGQVVVTVANYNKTVADFTTNSAPPVVTITSVGKVTLGDRTEIIRTLQSNVQPAKLFTNAIGALGSLAFTSGGLVDSYDSSAGLYAPVSRSFSAVVSGESVDLYKASVYGFASTKGTVLQADEAVAIVTGSAVGHSIETARISSSGNQPLFDPLPPSGPHQTPSSLDLTTSDTISVSGVYNLNSINLGDSMELKITAPNVVLKVYNSVKTWGSGKITVASTGSLELQIDEHDGQGLVLQGSGGIDNQTYLPQNVSVVFGGISYPNPAASTVDVTTDFYGSIYMPNDTLSVGDSSIYGVIVAKNINFTGNSPSVHYDTALRKIGIQGVDTPMAVVQLREVSPATP